MAFIFSTTITIGTAAIGQVVRTKEVDIERGGIKAKVLSRSPPSSQSKMPVPTAEESAESVKEKKIITVVLDKASLETIKMKSGQYCLLNCDDHQVSKHSILHHI